MALRKTIVPALLAGTGIAGAAPAAWAQSSGEQVQTAAFDISAGELAPALQTFARQAGVEVIFSASDVGGLRTAGVSGRLSPREALARLLRGTDMAAIYDRSGAILIRPARRAQGNSEAAAPPAIPESEIVVTGTRIRGVDVPVPTIELDREDFANGGYTSIEQVFESLPQNFDEVTPDGRFANEGGSQLRGLNNERVAAIDLRGLGAQSTLTLVNGSRRAGSVDGRVVDISVIPLSILERVEVVTGGRSAIYGADAVAGVVNLITRREFDGAETQASFSTAETGGGERFNVSQIVGTEGARGGFVAAYDFAREWPLDLADVGLLSPEPNPEIGLVQRSLNAQTDMSRHSGYLAGRYELTDRVEIFADGLYSHKRFEDFSVRFFEGAAQDSFTDTHNKAEHLSLSGGARAALGADWTLNLSGGWSSARNRQDSLSFIDLGGFSLEFESAAESEASLATLSAVADGPLFSIGGITPRIAAGVEWRREGFERVLDGAQENDADRTVRSAFAELFIPLVESGGAGMRRLEVTLAGRYDDYSDVGDTFNPQGGISWEPIDGLTLRGAYSTAFRAPALVELDPSVEAFLELASDPTAAGALVPVLFVQGQIASLKPEEAETWSLGFDYEPAFAPWLKTSFSYFDVRYDGRIEQPSVNADRELVLERAERYPGLVTRGPSADQASSYLALDEDGFISNDTGLPFDPATQAILEVFPDLVLFDNRTTNIAIEEVRGLDVSADAEFDTDIGRVNLGLNVTHTLDHERKVTPASPAFGLLNEVGKPVDTRGRAKAGWSNGAVSAFTFVNYIDDYANPFSATPSRMDSWTTIDLTLRFQGAELADGGFLDGFDASVGVKNLLDSAPPLFPNSLQGVLYDSTNANPLGRYFTFALRKNW